MQTVKELLSLLGGITVFLLGLKLISDNVTALFGNKTLPFMRSCASNRYSACLIGAGITAVCQSSVATNVVAVGLVESGVLSFFQASAFIVGTNIGTTVTAQIVSLSGASLDISAIGSVIAFIGFILYLGKPNKKYFGGSVLGLGLIFIGLELIGNAVTEFDKYLWFEKLFVSDNPLLLILNGFVVTSIAQSSSVVSSVLVILACKGLLPFESAMFLILGSNVGTCMPVIISSMKLSKPSRQSAVFNLVFNLIGVLVLFIPLAVFKSEITEFFRVFSKTDERMIANFHTLFNVFVALMVLPLLNPVTCLVEKLSKFSQKVDKIRALV